MMRVVTTGLQLLAGLLLLTAGSEILIRGAAALAAAARVSPLVIGLTVVAYGTSMPELVVSLQSAWNGNADVALGNVVGSNIFNVLFILGVSSMIVPLAVAQKLVRIDVPLMIGLSALLLLLGLDGRLGRTDGWIFVGGLGIYTILSILLSRREQQAVQQEYAEAFARRSPVFARQLLWQGLLALVGLALLAIGSSWFTAASIGIARSLGLPELIIGLTIVAAGTSLPEVATSIMAALRGERDIAVGNVVGSNIFNILGVLGLSSVVAPAGVAIAPTALTFDIPVMIAVAVACLPIFLTGHCIARWEGVLFFGYYCAYTAWLILEATQAPFGRTFAMGMLAFVIPLTVLTLVVAFVRRRSPAQGPEA